MTARGPLHKSNLYRSAACNVSQRSTWFRDLPSGTAFGVTDSNGAGCNLVAPPSGTTLYALDNSLQLQVGLVSSLFYVNPNPCTGKTPGQAEAQTPQAAASGPAQSRRTMHSQPQLIKITHESIKITHERIPPR
jgi:hypothetical protein